MNTVYLLLGGNKGDKLQNLQHAIRLLKEQVGKVSKCSDIFVTAAWGNTNQPDFYNQAICIETPLSANNLLQQTISIEESLGRIRTEKKWEQRTMDIDILFYNDEIIDTLDLKIPHPYIQERKFVLIPMAQIASLMLHPKLQKNIQMLLSECVDTLEVTRLIQ
jgi:2-amino-4-hydroxy-6-hydroxymethyldihydropteridine diphosphokinase